MLTFLIALEGANAVDHCTVAMLHRRDHPLRLFPHTVSNNLATDEFLSGPPFDSTFRSVATKRSSFLEQGMAYDSRKSYFYL